MDNTYILGPDGELYHAGVKGMKWGQRLYQNKDGSLTPLGRRRYNKQKNTAVAKRQATLAAKKKAADDEATAKAKRDKDIEAGRVSPKKMTTEELNRRIERLNLEKTYNEAVIARRSSSYKKAEQFLNKFIDKTIEKVAENVTADLVAQALKVIAAKGVNNMLEANGFDRDVHTNNKKKG